VTNKVHELAETWETVLARRLPLLGHRNWIVIADSAYPEQSNPGIETIATETDHLQVLTKTIDAITRCGHVRANVLLDAELKAVGEEDAPGVTAFRHDLQQLFGDRNALELEHDQIISKMDKSGALFRILILKSTLRIPYSSVFLELDCAYWDSASEKRVRSSLKHQSEAHDMTHSTGLRPEKPRFSGPFSRRM
jgi:hypothetical protein